MGDKGGKIDTFCVTKIHIKIKIVPFKGTFWNHRGVAIKVDTIYKESLKECLKRSLKRIFIGPHRKSPLKTRLFFPHTEDQTKIKRY